MRYSMRRNLELEPLGSKEADPFLSPLTGLKAIGADDFSGTVLLDNQVMALRIILIAVNAFSEFEIPVQLPAEHIESQPESRFYILLRLSDGDVVMMISNVV